MKHWLAHHARTCGATLARLIRTPLATLLNASVIGVALALPVGFHLALVNIQTFAGNLASAPQLSLFLSREAQPQDVAQIRAQLEKHTGIRHYRFVPRDEALRSIRASSGVEDLIDTLKANPLPDAFVLDAADGSVRNLQTLREEIGRWPKVEHVQLDALWAQRLEALLELGQVLVIVLGALLGFALVAVTFNTIRLQILTQRAEIEIARLIGATDPYIRRPFLYFGALLGLSGGAAALAIVLAAGVIIGERLGALSHLYGTALTLQPLGIPDSASLLVFAAGLGWLGARLSVGRHLRGATEPSQ